MSQNNTPKEDDKPESDESYYFGGITVEEFEETNVHAQNYGGYLIAST